MPRLINSKNGVVVNVDDETAARLGSDFAPEVQEVPAEPKRSAGRPKKSEH